MNSYHNEIIPEGVIYKSEKNRLAILLLVPFYSFYPKYETRRAGCPIGLEMIVAELVNKGFNVIFIDACMSKYNQFTKQINGTIRYGLTNQQLKKLLNKYNPDVVGITSLFSNQSKNTALVAKIVRDTYPNTIIIEGGGHATGAVNEVLSSGIVNIVVRSEGFITFTKLCTMLENNDDIYQLKGISYCNDCGELRHNPNEKFCQNLDSLAPRLLEIPLHPMYNTLEHTGGSRGTKKGRHVYVITSIGCPGHCKFCLSDLMTGRKTRFFGIKRIKNQIKQFVEAGVKEIIIEDDQFLADIPRAMKIMDIFKKNNVLWFEEGGISMFKLMKPGHNLAFKDIIDKMSSTGCYRFYLAIESANSKSLESSLKPSINTKLNKAKIIINYIASKNIEAVGGFMLGFKNEEYEETGDEIRHTIEYAKKLKKAGLAHVMLFIYTALPGTVIFPFLKQFISNYTSHERAGFTTGGYSPKKLAEKRLVWMKEINGGNSTNITQSTKNWGI